PRARCSTCHTFLAARGLDAPREPAFVGLPGITKPVSVPSAALGGRSQETYVYLPSAYAPPPRRRSPVLYPPHGFPGRPLAFRQTVQMGVIAAALTARRRAHPL